MIKPKSDQELAIIRHNGRVATWVLTEICKSVKVGVTTLELDRQAERMLNSKGLEAGFKKVPGYGFATCITVGADIVHGIPGDYKLQSGDVVSVDMGGYGQGLHTDCAWSVQVGEQSQQNFLAVGRRALLESVKKAAAGNRVGDIGATIQGIVEGQGFYVIRELVGHGIGHALHEQPQVPGYGRPRTGPELVPGMTIAIEVIYSQSKTKAVYKNDDGWTITTANNCLSGLFEETVIVGRGKVQIVTPVHHYL